MRPGDDHRRRTYSCKFTRTVYGDFGEPDHSNTVTAVASDDDGNSDTETGTATVSFTDVLPDITVTKTADDTSVPETGQDVEFTVSVKNNSAEAATLNSLNDSDSATSTGSGPGRPGGTDRRRRHLSCKFHPDHLRRLRRARSLQHRDRGRLRRRRQLDTETGTATVSFTYVVADASLGKTVVPTTMSEPGGTFTATLAITNNSRRPPPSPP